MATVRSSSCGPLFTYKSCYPSLPHWVSYKLFCCSEWHLPLAYLHLPSTIWVISHHMEFVKQFRSWCPLCWLRNKLADLYPHLELNMAQMPQSATLNNLLIKKRVTNVYVELKKKKSVANKDLSTHESNWSLFTGVDDLLWDVAQLKLLELKPHTAETCALHQGIPSSPTPTCLPANLSLTAVNSHYTKSVCHSHCSASQHHWWRLSWSSLNYYNRSKRGEVPQFFKSPMCELSCCAGVPEVRPVLKRCIWMPW